MQLPSYLRPVDPDEVARVRSVEAASSLPDELSERLAGALIRARGTPYAMGAMMRKELSKHYGEPVVRAVVAEMVEGLMVGAEEGGSWL